MPPIEILKDIHWVGAIDWNIRDFHGYSIYRGTTYNAFLILDEKITLFDTVKKGFKSELLHHIRRIIDPTKIDPLLRKGQEGPACTLSQRGLALRSCRNW
jgi:flavorubredoxin